MMEIPHVANDDRRGPGVPFFFVNRRDEGPRILRIDPFLKLQGERMVSLGSR